MSLSEALKRFRKAYGVTQVQVAAAAGCNTRGWQFYESGKVVPTVTVLMAVADAYDVSLDYLVGRSDNPTRR